MRFDINNKVMKNFILGLVCVVSPFFSFAHNPLSARFHLEAGEHASLLTISLSQSGINQALLKKYSKDRLAEINQIDLEELIVDYIKDNFNLSVGGKTVVLKKGGIKMGSHQTDLKFVLPAFSKNVERIDIHIPAFKENDHHQTIFSYNVHGRTDHVILSLSNDYQSTIMFSTSVHSSNWHWYLLIGVAGLILVVFYTLSKPAFRVFGHGSPTLS